MNLKKFANFSIFHNTIYSISTIKEKLYPDIRYAAIFSYIPSKLDLFTFERRVRTYYHYHRAHFIRVIRSELRYARHVPLYRISCHVFHASS